jgi:hypothetical protein
LGNRTCVAKMIGVQRYYFDGNNKGPLYQPHSDLRGQVRTSRSTSSSTSHGASPHSPDVKSGKRRKFRKRKRRKPLKRKQPERKEKYRERQRRANHEQRHDLSKLIARYEARHDTQRQRCCLTPMHSTASAVIARWDLYRMMGETLALEHLPYCGSDARL